MRSLAPASFTRPVFNKPKSFDALIFVRDVSARGSPTLVAIVVELAQPACLMRATCLLLHSRPWCYRRFRLGVRNCPYCVNRCIKRSLRIADRRFSERRERDHDDGLAKEWNGSVRALLDSCLILVFRRARGLHSIQRFETIISTKHVSR